MTMRARALRPVVDPAGPAGRREELASMLGNGPCRLGLLQEATPLHPAPRLSDRLRAEIYLKRDDLVGMGFGGNKVRALDYVIADALRDGYDSIVTGAGPQSNWSMLAALTALRYGLEPHIISYGPDRPPSGNLVLHQRLGVSVRFTGEPDKVSVDAEIAVTAGRLRAAGRHPYVIPRGGATSLGALGYVRASLELAWQLDELGIDPAQLWLATGSCGTQAGLVAGKGLLGAGYDVVGVTVSRPEAECRQRVSTLVSDAAGLLKGDVGEPPVIVRDGWVGPGYGTPSAPGNAAIDLLARTEGIFLDPVFGAKAMAALIDGCRSGQITGPVVFLVTGGGPTLFASENTPA
jgi:D-cysteine desulfhydrase